MRATPKALISLVVSVLNLATQAILLYVFAWSVFAPLIAGMAVTLGIGLWAMRSSYAALSSGGSSPSPGVRDSASRAVQWTSFALCVITALAGVALLVWVATVCPHEHDC